MACMCHYHGHDRDITIFNDRTYDDIHRLEAKNSSMQASETTTLNEEWKKLHCFQQTVEHQPIFRCCLVGVQLSSDVHKKSYDSTGFLISNPSWPASLPLKHARQRHDWWKGKYGEYAKQIYMYIPELNNTFWSKQCPSLEGLKPDLPVSLFRTDPSLYGEASWWDGHHVTLRLGPSTTLCIRNGAYRNG